MVMQDKALTNHAVFDSRNEKWMNLLKLHGLITFSTLLYKIRTRKTDDKQS